MREIINNMFLCDVLSKIDNKYYQLVKPYLNKTFLFSNFFEFPSYYKIFNTKTNKNYSLDNKLFEDRNEQVLELISTEILENNYNKEYLLFFYAYISSIVLRSVFDEYNGAIISDKKDFNKNAKMLESVFYKNRTNTSIKKVKIYKEFNLELSSDINNLYNIIFSDIYYFSFGIDVYKKSIKKYLKIQKHLANDPIGFNKLLLSIHDLFRPNNTFKVSLLSSLIIVKKDNDLLNNNHKKIVMFANEVDKSFIDIYDEAVNTAVTFINDYSEDILYKKKTIKNNIKNLL